MCWLCVVVDVCKTHRLSTGYPGGSVCKPCGRTGRSWRTAGLQVCIARLWQSVWVVVDSWSSSRMMPVAPATKLQSLYRGNKARAERQDLEQLRSAEWEQCWDETTVRLPWLSCFGVGSSQSPFHRMLTSTSTSNPVSRVGILLLRKCGHQGGGSCRSPSRRHVAYFSCLVAVGGRSPCNTRLCASTTGCLWCVSCGAGHASV